MTIEDNNPDVEDHSSKDNKPDVEGLGNDEDSSWGDYPIDTVLIRNENRTVYDVLRRIEKGSFIMNPDFQRDFIWPEDKQSKLIESVMMRIPLPVFYLAEDEDGRLIVVDGLQRLSTFQRFKKNKLSLKLPDQKELNKKKFRDLSPKLQNRIEDCNLILYVIDVKVPERARLDIFERVNAGVPLTRQQMRNCLYMGKATKFLSEQAKLTLFKETTGNSLKVASMRDREFINRFCAFQLLPMSEYKSDMDNFLAKCLTKMNSLSHEDLDKLSDQLKLSLQNNKKVFGIHSFRKSANSGRFASRTIINASLWDVFSTGFSRYSRKLIESKIKEVKNGFSDLMEDDRFIQSITIGTNDKRRVKFRFESVKNMLEEVFDV
jgi:hypothetical protein